VGPIAEPNLIAPDAAVPSLAIPEQGAGSATTAIAEVTALERAGALAGRLAPDAHVFCSRLARAVGAAAPAAMAVPSGDVTYTLARIEASAAGDLAMVLGEARWDADGGEASGLFGRIWQRRADGWRIVYDQLIQPHPPPPPG
jgi:ketosteroid isomerase-like protein